MLSYSLYRKNNEGVSELHSIDGKDSSFNKELLSDLIFSIYYLSNTFYKEIPCKIISEPYIISFYKIKINININERNEGDDKGNIHSNIDKRNIHSNIDKRNIHSNIDKRNIHSNIYHNEYLIVCIDYKSVNIKSLYEEFINGNDIVREEELIRFIDKQNIL